MPSFASAMRGTSAGNAGLVLYGSAVGAASFKGGGLYDFGICQVYLPCVRVRAADGRLESEALRPFLCRMSQ